ncbi:MAG: pilus assembly protein PilM [Desulfobulbaceae bacterium]|jgi:type IV pilus assembly protein PilM|nr:pilus assembly protein PilM [Desulfobulbaceae bacterium]
MLKLPFLSNNDLVVGLDIGSHAVKVCELERRDRGYSIVAVGSAILPDGAVEDGVLVDAEVVSSAISALLKNLKIRKKKVGISISGYSVIVKKISLAIMDENKLESYIMAEAEQYIPFDLDDVYLDFQDMKTSSAGNDRTDVMLVAAKKEVVDDFTTMLEGIGLTPVIVDIDGFALENAHEIITRDVDNVALVDIGASKMSINIISGGVSVVARDISVGSRQLTEQIQDLLDMEFEEAEAVKLGKRQELERQDDIAAIYSSVCTQWVLEIKKAIDLYHANHPDQPLRRLSLSGGGSKVVGLSDFLQIETGLEVEIFNPLVSMNFNAKKIDPDYVQVIGQEMAIASGIAIRSSAI